MFPCASPFHNMAMASEAWPTNHTKKVGSTYWCIGVESKLLEPIFETTHTVYTISLLFLVYTASLLHKSRVSQKAEVEKLKTNI